MDPSETPAPALNESYFHFFPRFQCRRSVLALVLLLYHILERIRSAITSAMSDQPGTAGSAAGNDSDINFNPSVPPQQLHHCLGPLCHSLEA